MLCLAALFLYYCCWYSPGSCQEKQDHGIEHDCPASPKYLLGKAAARKEHKGGGFKKAYEVHIFGQGGEFCDFLRLFTADLELAQKAFPGAVFLWESSAPLPLLVRMLIRQGSVNGSAFLKMGVGRCPGFRSRRGVYKRAVSSAARSLRKRKGVDSTNRKTGIIIAVVLAIICTLAIEISANRKYVEATKTVQAIQATQFIPVGEKIDAGMVKAVAVPAQMAQFLAIGDVTAVVGKSVKVSIWQGQDLMQDALDNQGRSPGTDEVFFR